VNHVKAYGEAEVFFTHSKAQNYLEMNGEFHCPAIELEAGLFQKIAVEVFWKR
jgi:hypothetical protein